MQLPKDLEHIFIYLVYIWRSVIPMKAYSQNKTLLKGLNIFYVTLHPRSSEQLMWFFFLHFILTTAQWGRLGQDYISWEMLCSGKLRACQMFLYQKCAFYECVRKISVLLKSHYMAIIHIKCITGTTHSEYLCLAGSRFIWIEVVVTLR